MKKVFFIFFVLFASCVFAEEFEQNKPFRPATGQTAYSCFDAAYLNPSFRKKSKKKNRKDRRTGDDYEEYLEFI